MGQQLQAFALAALLPLGLCADATAQTYALVELAPPEPGRVFTRGLNSDGQVVGHWDREVYDGDRAFIWQSGIFTDLGGFGSSGGTLRDISETGIATGSVFDQNGVAEAVVWQDGTLTRLGTLGGLSSDGYGVNAQGEVVGHSRTLEGNRHAFYFDGVTMHDLGTLGGLNSTAYAINDAGVVVGESEDSSGKVRAFRWEAGTMLDLGTLGGAESTARDITESGTVVGESDLNSGRRLGFMWRDGQISALDGGVTQSGATSMSADETVVGYAQTSDWGGPARWTLSGGWQRIASLILDPGQWQISSGNVTRINDLGWIAGHAQPSSNSGLNHGFVLIPYDLPDRMQLSDPVPGLAGRVNTFTVTAAVPGATVYLGYGFRAGQTPIPGCPGVVVSIAAVRTGGSALVGVDGSAVIEGFVPGTARHVQLYFQMADADNCIISNRVTFRFQ